MTNTEIYSLSKRKVDVFILKDMGAITHHMYNKIYQLLSTTEQDKYHRFHFEKDKKLYLLSRYLQNKVLSLYTGQPIDTHSFTLNEYGKPELTKFKNIKFNLSNSSNCAVLIVTYGDQVECGIDVEGYVRKESLFELADSYFSCLEVEFLKKFSRTSDINYHFFRLWTLKESYIKAVGKGLSQSLASFSFLLGSEPIKIQHHVDELGSENDWIFHQIDLESHQFIATALKKSSAENMYLYRLNLAESQQDLVHNETLLKKINISDKSFCKINRLE